MLRAKKWQTDIWLDVHLLSTVSYGIVWHVTESKWNKNDVIVVFHIVTVRIELSEFQFNFRICILSLFALNNHLTIKIHVESIEQIGIIYTKMTFILKKQLKQPQRSTLLSPIS